MGVCTLELSFCAVHVLQTFEMGTEGEAPVNDVGQNRDEAMTSTAPVNLILEGCVRCIRNF